MTATGRRARLRVINQGVDEVEAAWFRRLARELEQFRQREIENRVQRLQGGYTRFEGYLHVSVGFHFDFFNERLAFSTRTTTTAQKLKTHYMNTLVVFIFPRF